MQLIRYPCRLAEKGRPQLGCPHDLFSPLELELVFKSGQAG